jgi:hypothetical protein
LRTWLDSQWAVLFFDVFVDRFTRKAVNEICQGQDALIFLFGRPWRDEVPVHDRVAIAGGVKHALRNPGSL